MRKIIIALVSITFIVIVVGVVSDKYNTQKLIKLESNFLYIQNVVLFKETTDSTLIGEMLLDTSGNTLFFVKNNNKHSVKNIRVEGFNFKTFK